MTYISIDIYKKQALKLLEYIKTLSFVTIHQEPNANTLKAMEVVKNGKTKKHKNSEDLISFLNK